MASRLLRPVGQLLNGCSKLGKIQPVCLRAASSSASYDQALSDMPITRMSQLDNGMKVASEDSDSAMATVGLWIDCGSRHEHPDLGGITHFFERMAFKGTNKRSQSDLELEVESMGAKIRSYTGREHTAFYAHCMSKDVPQVVEIISDMVENCKVGEAEMERERGAMLQALDQVSLHDELMDYLHSIAYQGTSLGHSPMGSTNVIKNLDRSKLLEYVTENFTAPRMVLVGAGGVNHDSLTSLASKHFKGYSGSDVSVPSYPAPARYTGSEVRVRHDDMPVAHMGLAMEGPGRGSRDNMALELGHVLLTGQTGVWNKTMGGLNSAFDLNRACTDGDLVHELRTYNLKYNGTGLWGVYYAADKMQIIDITYNIQQYWMRLCENMTDMDLERAKNNYCTKLILESQNQATVCKDIAENIIHSGRRAPLAEVIAEVNSLTSSSVRDVLTNYTHDMCPVQAGIGPIEQMEDYNRLRSGFSWLRV